MKQKKEISHLISTIVLLCLIDLLVAYLKIDLQYALCILFTTMVIIFILTKEVYYRL